MTTSPCILPQRVKVVNVASVPQRSPFRYPGGKTWLVPYVRRWLSSLGRRPKEFVEPFAGGGIVGLTVAAEDLADHVVIGELDHGVAAVWHTMLSGDAEWLVARILRFGITRANVVRTLSTQARTRRELAFQTLLRNRVQRGGIMAPGASLVKNGENGRGVSSRWYADTLAKRIRAIARLGDRIEFREGDGFDLLRRFRHRKTVSFFIDPPYTSGGKRAGRRLYDHNQVDHDRLFNTMAKAPGSVMMTYDDTVEIRRLADQHAFQIEKVPMKNTHHAVVYELVVSNVGSCLEPALPVAREESAYT
ncbi:MAG: DNA adenine methylase [Phycisphaerales bacterium]|nr:MAG: DNA adenine methylase [Phycisphaerales bacterium]